MQARCRAVGAAWFHGAQYLARRDFGALLHCCPDRTVCRAQGRCARGGQFHRDHSASGDPARERHPARCDGPYRCAGSRREVHAPVTAAVCRRRRFPAPYDRGTYAHGPGAGHSRDRRIGSRRACRFPWSRGARWCGSGRACQGGRGQGSQDGHRQTQQQAQPRTQTSFRSHARTVPHRADHGRDLWSTGRLWTAASPGASQVPYTSGGDPGDRVDFARPDTQAIKQPVSAPLGP